MQTAANQDTRLSFLQINDDTRIALQEFRPLLEREIDALLESFYRHIGVIAESSQNRTLSEADADGRR